MALAILGVVRGAFYLFVDSTSDGFVSFLHAADILFDILDDSSWMHPIKGLLGFG